MTVYRCTGEDHWTKSKLPSIWHKAATNHLDISSEHDNFSDEKEAFQDRAEDGQDFDQKNLIDNKLLIQNLNLDLRLNKGTLHQWYWFSMDHTDAEHLRRIGLQKNGK